MNTISGTITKLPDNTEALVSLSDGQEMLTTAGKYSFTVENGTYTIIPTLSGHEFTPASQTVTVLDVDVVADFVDPIDPPVINRSLTLTIPRENR